MKKNKFSIFVGVAVLALTVGLNVRHALNDYGVKSNKLHVEVLAQATTTDIGGTTSGGGSGSGSIPPPPPPPQGWCCQHFSCFDSNGNPTGKYSASSYQGSTCRGTTPHDHNCSSCHSY